MNENTTGANGYVVAHTSGGGQALHIVKRYGAGWNEFEAASLCGITPAPRWGSNIRWMQSGNTTYDTPAEAADGRITCKRCAAIAARIAHGAAMMAASSARVAAARAARAEAEAATPAEAAAPAVSPRRRREIEAGFMPEVTPAPAEAEAAPVYVFTITTHGPNASFGTLGAVLDTRTVTSLEAPAMRGRHETGHNGDTARREAARLDLGRFDGSVTSWERELYKFERGAVVIDISEAPAAEAAPAAVNESDPATWNEGGGYTWETPCSACDDGEFHYTRVSDGHCVSCAAYAVPATAEAEAAPAGVYSPLYREPVRAAHDRFCLFSAMCAAYENAEDHDGSRLDAATAEDWAYGYIAESLADCHCREGAPKLAEDGALVTAAEALELDPERRGAAHYAYVAAAAEVAAAGATAATHDMRAAWRFIVESYDTGYSPNRRDWTHEGILAFVAQHHTGGLDAVKLDVPAAHFEIGQTVKFDGYRTGTVIAIQDAEDSISGKKVVRVETHPYKNKVWFDEEYLAPVDAPAAPAEAAAPEAKDAPARGSHWAMEFPALNGTVVMQGHADYCSAHGHATHNNDGVISPWCPRCGDRINADTVTDAAMARALELAVMSAPGAHRVDTGRKASDLQAYDGGDAIATVITYFQGGPGRGECIDAVIIAASGGSNQPQRVFAATDALERLQGRVSGNITAGQYQTIATGPGGGVLFIFGTWEDGE